MLAVSRSLPSGDGLPPTAANSPFVCRTALREFEGPTVLRTQCTASFELNNAPVKHEITYRLPSQTILVAPRSSGISCCAQLIPSIEIHTPPNASNITN